jgi:hypothetical protein
MTPGVAVRTWLTGALVLVFTSSLHAPTRAAQSARAGERAVDESTWVDHDGSPIPKPKEREIGTYGHLFREALVEQIARAFDIPDKILWVLGAFGVEKNVDAVNVNAFDEVPNSSWFMNRNHMRAVTPAAIKGGPAEAVAPVAPYTIKSVKKHGFNPGFNIKDAAGNRWVVKLDAPGYPGISSGAGVVTSRLVWAAGYNVTHDQAFTFRREQLKLDPDVVKGSDEDPPFDEADLDSLLVRSARDPNGRYYAGASFFLKGALIGPLDFRGKRKDDPNDWYRHKNRRELRALYVLYSWLNNWDVKDHQSLDSFMTPSEDDSIGHVVHYLLDMNASLGASATGPKPVYYGYEQKIDLGWTLKRFVSLGFAVEPWRRARQKSGIPSVGNFESEEFRPGQWRPSQYVEPFRKMLDSDGYWGAKLVASFSDAQIAAAIDAAGYDDPRAVAYVFKTLVERRDKVARYWFDKVAPLDFFHVEGGVLRFHDLGVDMGLAEPRGYDVAVHGGDGSVSSLEAPLRGTELHLEKVARSENRLSLKLSVAGSHAEPARVELVRKGALWVVQRVRHG